MVAVVVENKKRGQRHSIKTELCGRLCVILAGDKVSKRRLKRKLMRYGNDVIALGGFSAEFSKFSSNEYRKSILFNGFAEFILTASKNYSVGIYRRRGTRVRVAVCYKRRGIGFNFGVWGNQCVCKGYKSA